MDVEVCGTFFRNKSQFPEVTSEGNIYTVDFLEASRGIVSFIELLGKAFLPVKYDVNGNIEKLQTIYKTDELKFKHLSSIVIHEMNDDKDKDKVGTDALLWLKRALQYIQVFLSYFVEDYVQGNCTEDLVPFFRKAYEEKLKQYHGFIIQNLFGLCLRAAPGRKQLIVLLSNGKEDKEGEVFDDLKNFLVGMTANLDIIVDLYKKYNFEV